MSLSSDPLPPGGRHTGEEDIENSRLQSAPRILGKKSDDTSSRKCVRGVKRPEVGTPGAQEQGMPGDALLSRMDVHLLTDFLCFFQHHPGRAP